MKFMAHDYQRFAIRRIVEQPACGLFLDMGLGKTVITLTAIVELMHNRFDVARVLVIAPKLVAETVWAEEAAKWDHTRHLRISKVLGSVQERVAALRRPADIYVINRENVPWLVERVGAKWPFDMVVVDELSSFKSPKTKRFRALRRVRPLVNRIVGLTGTPAPNGLIDLWSQIYLLDQGERLGKTLTGYRDRFFKPGRRNGHIVYEWIPKPGAEERIHELLSDLCVSMRAEDWLELPERVDVEVPVVLDAEAMMKYKQLEKDLLLPLEGDVVTADTAGVLTNKLLQLANGAVYDTARGVHEIHDAKLDALEELIEQAQGKPLLVFYAYQHDLERIKRRFPWAATMDEPGVIERWNRGEVPLLLAHPASAGHGLNLQEGGNHVVWFGLTWSLELYEQANARLHRQGQTERVIVHHLVAKGTVDEDVMARLRSKAATQADLVEALKARIERVRKEMAA